MSQPVVRRTSIAIIAEILRLLRLGETGKTEIMCTVKLSYQMTPKYLSWLLKSGLVTEVMKEYELVSYRITEKGLNLLSQIDNLQEMLHVTESFDIFHRPELTKKIAQSKPAVESSEIKEF